MEKGEWHEDEGSSHQNKTFQQFQDRTKPNPNANLVSRETEEKKERGMWIFKRKKKRQHVLDRVISSSQPDLLCSAPVGLDGQESPLCGKVNPSSGYSRNIRQAGAEREQPDAQTSTSSMENKTPTVAYLVQSHHKSSSLGSACLEHLGDEPAARNHAEALEDEQLEDINSWPHCPKSVGIDPGLEGMGAHVSSGAPSQTALPSSTMYKLDIDLKRGNNLAIRDRGGTSDPYVKFKWCGKEVFRSRTIHKNLNPVWEESTSLLVDNLHESLYVKVFDYDFGLQDDFIGSAYLYLESLEHHRTQPVILTLTDPHHPDQDLGTLELAVTLTPNDSPLEEHKEPPKKDSKTHRWKPYVNKTMLLRRSWKRSNKRQESERLSEVHRKAQLWRGIVSISLIEGRDLVPMDPNGLSDPYAKFRLGPQKYKSKTMPKTLCPQWREQFDLHMYEETGGVLDISVWDKDTGRRDDFIGRCKLDLSTLVKEHTHRLELELEECRGVVVLLVTLTASSHVSIADLSFTPLDDPQERQLLARRYGVLRSFFNLRDVGVVQVKVMRAEGLMAADVTGKSDPFCVLELNNDRLQTHTVYKTLNPEWNKVFTFNVKDIHSVLEVTVFDEDRDRSADFLGKVAIPLLQIQDGEQKGYVLKNKKLTGPTKGVIYLEAEVMYSSIKAGLRTLVPAEQKYIEEESKLSKHLFQQNFNRVKRCIMVLINLGTYVNSCFEWESSQRSIGAFLLFVVVVWNFELYMLPLALLLILAWNFCFSSSRGTEDMGVDAMFEWEEDEEERDDKDFERKGFMGKLYAIQDVCITVQSALDEVASYGERIKNVFNWTVPFLSWLAISALCVATFLLYIIPLRYLVLTWGVNKFTKKLRDPYLIDNNELLDFLSRVPSDVQVVQYRELKVDPGQSPNKRRRTNPG